MCLPKIVNCVNVNACEFINVSVPTRSNIIDCIICNLQLVCRTACYSRVAGVSWWIIGHRGLDAKIHVFSAVCSRNVFGLILAGHLCGMTYSQPSFTNNLNKTLPVAKAAIYIILPKCLEIKSLQSFELSGVFSFGGVFEVKEKTVLRKKGDLNKKEYYGRCTFNHKFLSCFSWDGLVSPPLSLHCTSGHPSV